MIAAAGLVYAHWTTTLLVQANVNTGRVDVEWQNMFTNDDGVPNPGDGELASNTLYDAWGDQSSLDPSSPTGDRYNKDVARCWADSDGQDLNVNVENAYPSYHCGIHGDIRNRGDIPLRATSIDGYAEFDRCAYWEWEFPDGDNPGPIHDGDVAYDDEGPFADTNGNGEFDGTDYRLWEDCRRGTMDFVPTGTEGAFELQYDGTPQIEGDIALGLRCGFQIDPIMCNWHFVSDDSPFYGDVHNCAENDDAPCAFDESQNNLGEVYELCEGPAYGADGWFHVMQAADQGTQYRWTLEQDFVNWNEFWAGLCTSGVPVVEGDGTETGQYACANDVEGGTWTDPTGTAFDGMVYPADLASCLAG